MGQQATQCHVERALPHCDWGNLMRPWLLSEHDKKKKKKEVPAPLYSGFSLKMQRVCDKLRKVDKYLLRLMTEKHCVPALNPWEHYQCPQLRIGEEVDI